MDRDFVQSLTLDQSLNITYRMWSLIADGHTRLKSHALYLALGELGLGRYRHDFRHDCLICQYVCNTYFLDEEKVYSNTDGVSPCKTICPLKSIWPHGCYHRSSPYYRWTVGNKTECAPQIVEGIKRVRQRLQGKI